MDANELILIVDDEHALAETLSYNLRDAGFRTRIAFSGQSALEAAEQEPQPELVLLDVMLPDVSGTEVCRRLRSSEATQHIPVVMLTAKDSEIDRVVGFELGADDYVTKPFSVRELVLRVRAVLRRAGKRETTEESGQLRFGRLVVDAGAHQVWVDKHEVMLTALEFRLLRTMMERKGRVQTRRTLLEDVWGIQADVTTRTVDTHVKRLREKLDSAGKFVETIRGVGYRFRASPTEGE